MFDLVQNLLINGFTITNGILQGIYILYYITQPILTF